MYVLLLLIGLSFIPELQILNPGTTTYFKDSLIKHFIINNISFYAKDKILHVNDNR